MSITRQVTYGGQRTTDTLDGKIRIEEGNGRLLITDGANNIGLLGYDSKGNIVVKIAKQGHNADTATNDQLIFNSSQNVFKIVGTVTLTSSSYLGSVTAGQVGKLTNTTVLAHNFGFTPQLVASIQIGSTYYPLPRANKQIDSGNIGWLDTVWQVNADNTNLYLTIDTFMSAVGSSTNIGVTAGAFNVKVFLLQETAN